MTNDKMRDEVAEEVYEKFNTLFDDSFVLEVTALNIADYILARDRRIMQRVLDVLDRTIDEILISRPDMMSRTNIQSIGIKEAIAICKEYL